MSDIVVTPDAQPDICFMKNLTELIRNIKGGDGSSSVGNDIKKSFMEEDKSTDGAVVTYYAFDDGDINSTVRATVLWEKP